jgi:catechol 2,3-dioxygenase-like lactoylglutathione lyase family enzyme
MDTKLEVVVLPVSDVDMAKAFYTALGWREDGDFGVDETFRVVQMTPPGSQASVIFGRGVTDAAPGSVQDVVLAVDDVAEARDELAARGAEVSEVWHDEDGVFYHAATRKRLAGRDPQGRTYASFASFTDPDGNGFVLQEVTSRLPGRLWSDVGDDVATLAELLRDAEEHHGRYEPTAPKHHWYDWYAAYIVARRLGRSQDDAYREASATLEASLG